MLLLNIYLQQLDMLKPHRHPPLLVQLLLYLIDDPIDLILVVVQVVLCLF